ncbi:MAG TPA: family 16 glycoside hydrolase [Opitutaceae bacterium]|nr:family 16 glycoside hydrolase [Opitutaceae bacterium]
MPRLALFPFLGLMAAFAACKACAQTGPHLATATDVLFRDDFSREETGPAWKTNDAAKKAPGQSRIVDGALVTKMAPHSDHGATVNTAVTFTDAVITFRFRLLDDRGFNRPVNDLTEKSVHAGHICRVKIAPGRVQLQDDKTGQMNLEVQKLRENPATAKEAAARLAGTTASFNAPIEVGRWHALRVELVGDEMLVHVDGKIVGYHKSPGFAHTAKRSFGFTVTGATGVAFDDVILAKAIRSPNWAAESSGAIALLRPTEAKKRK